MSLNSTPEQPDQEKKKSFLSRSAGWFALISGPVLVLFVVGLGSVLFQMALANDYRIFFGVSASYKWLFYIPWVFGIIGLVMVIAALNAWIRRFWSGWTRVYYSLLAISAVVCVYVLAVWGVYTALI